LEPQLAATRRLVERRRVRRRERQREAAGQDVVAGGSHRRSTMAPVGSVFPPATKARLQSATCAVDAPRICRTASAVLLNPWTNASESWPPFVFETSRPSGHSRPPRSTNAPPSPAGAKP